MKKIVLTFGLISGALMAIFMYSTMPFVDRIGMDRMMFVVYTWIVLAFLLIFFGIRSYRENVAGGVVSFGRAFAVGILITLISCACYVIAWQVFYYAFMPDFFEKYSAHVIEQARASGATPEALQAQIKEQEEGLRILKNPFFHVLFVFLEPLPVGLIITLISAMILRKKRSEMTPETAAAG
jgi:hypothetical protein